MFLRKNTLSIIQFIQKSGPLVDVIALGFFVRLLHLFSLRPLWLDEAYLAPNVLDRSWGQLFDPLVNYQMSPIGFLFVSKLLVSFVHPCELGLRIAPFIASLTGIFVVLRICRILKLSDLATLAVMAFVALLDPYVYYAAEFKQYSFEFLMTALTLWATLEVLNRKSWGVCLLFLINGFFVVLFSLAAPFVLAPAGAMVFYVAVRDRKYIQGGVIAVSALLWAALFVFCLWMAGTFSSRTSDVMLKFWVHEMRPNGLLNAVKWCCDAPLVALKAAGLSAFFGFPLILGILDFVRKKQGGILFLLMAPLILAFIAALFNQYPFYDRVLLFAMPGVLVVVSVGLVEMYCMLSALRVARAWIVSAFVIALVPCFISTVSESIRARPFDGETLTRTMSFVSDNIEKGQSIYVHTLAAPVYRLYAEREGLKSYPTTYMHDSRSILRDTFNYNERTNYAYFLRDIEQLQGKGKVWLIFSSRLLEAGKADVRTALHFADMFGKQILSHDLGSSSAYLYDFNGEERIKLSSDVLPPFDEMRGADQP